MSLEVGTKGDGAVSFFGCGVIFVAVGLAYAFFGDEGTGLLIAGVGCVFIVIGQWMWRKWVKR